MTQLEKLKTLSEEKNEALLQIYLDMACHEIVTRAFPYEEDAELPLKYEPLQLEIALYLYNKRGAEGQTAHSENGINRSYESSDIPLSLLRKIVPKGQIL